MLSHLNDDQLKIKPLAEASTLPSTCYVDDFFHSWEIENLHRKTWQGVGSVQLLADSGGLIKTTLAGNPVIIFDDEDGKVRAFYDVCQHRGGPLERKESSGLKCRYHGWTYRFDGTLAGTPEFDGVDDFEREKVTLKSIGLVEWQGLLFLNLDPDAPDPQSAFVDIAKIIAPLDLSSLKLYRRVMYDVKSNWKVYVDNYQEAYHLGYVHEGLSNLLDYETYKTEVNEHFTLQSSPISDTDKMYSGSGNMAYYFTLFPNFMLNILPGRLQTNLIVPVSANRCQVIFDYYYEDISTPEARDRIEKEIEFSDEIQREDIEICERVQEGLSTPAYDEGRYSIKREEGLHAFHNYMRAIYRQNVE